MTAGQVLAALGFLVLLVAGLKAHDFYLRHKHKKKHRTVKPLSDSELLK